jgi:thiosulfate/3-mercaptopyruvate sulfurtransferase
MTDPLISADALALALRGPNPPVVVDCGFDLADPEAGRRAHAAAHVPGAVYAHLDATLSSGKTGRNGRHPLPDRETVAARMAALGIGDETAVVAYDAAGGVYAARLWWMLRWAGHAAVSVLDGGLGAWTAAGHPTTDEPTPPRVPARFTLRPALAVAVDGDAVEANLATRRLLVVDARSPDRYRGENETLDPVAGHIPGATNRFFKGNLGPDGRFRAPAELRAAFEAAHGGRPPAEVVAQCGSGVTACHNLLAMEVAGLPGAALYPGSWSEWIARPGAPVARGADAG